MGRSPSFLVGIGIVSLLLLSSGLSIAEATPIEPAGDGDTTLSLNETVDVAEDTLNETTNATEETLDETTDSTEGALDDTVNSTGETLDETENTTSETLDETANSTGETLDETVESTDGTLDETAESTDGTLEEATESTNGSLDGTVDSTSATIDETTDTTADVTADTLEDSSTVVRDGVNTTMSTELPDELDGTLDETTRELGGIVAGIDGTLWGTIDATIDAVDAIGDVSVDAVVGSSDTTSTGTVETETGRGADDDVSFAKEARFDPESADRGGDGGGRIDGDVDRVTAGTDVSDGASSGDPSTGTGNVLSTALASLLVIVANASAVAGSASTASVTTAFSTRRGWRPLRELRAILEQWWKRLALFSQYSRYDDSDPLENDHRRALYETISERPGIYLSALGDSSELSLSTVRHHVRVLQRENLIETDLIRGKRRFYVVGTDGTDRAAALADPTTRRILDALADLGSARNHQIAESLDRCPSTVSHHLTSLEEAGLVVRERKGREVVNRLAASLGRTPGDGWRTDGGESATGSADPDA